MRVVAGSPAQAAARAIRHGGIYISSEGGLRYLALGIARVDPALLRLAAKTARSGDRVWDILIPATDERAEPEVASRPRPGRHWWAR
jgi:hypothetical protein